MPYRAFFSDIFFLLMPIFSTSAIAELVAGTLHGAGDCTIHALAKIESAHAGALSFIANSKYARFAEITQAECILVGKKFDLTAPRSEQIKAVIVCDDPYLAFVRMVKEFAPDTSAKKNFIHSSAVIAETATIHPTAHIGAHVSIGEHCIIGDNVELRAGVVLYDHVEIGSGSVLHGNVVCYQDTKIGVCAIIHAGTVLGADGFGFAELADKSFAKIPQIGNVVIGDGVEIGANCTIDRAALGSTVIEHGVKIDNLVHVAHNCVIQEHTAIAAQTGVSGSTVIGKRNRLAGQVGVVGHIATADDVIVYAQSGVSHDIEQKGIYFGSPAKPHIETMKIEAASKQLPQLVRDVRALMQHRAQEQKKP
jgi:UDP-3-O-[3-hydroxymyristoyl] glucosamine N-acyltransferase